MQARQNWGLFVRLPFSTDEVTPAKTTPLSLIPPSVLSNHLPGPLLAPITADLRPGTCHEITSKPLTLRHIFEIVVVQN